METTMRLKVQCLRWVVGSMDCNETATMIPASVTKTYEDLPPLDFLTTFETGDDVRARSYADDISAVVRDGTVFGMRIKLWDLQAIVRAYEQAERGEIHDSKAFTFGDSGVAGLLRPDMAHLLYLEGQGDLVSILISPINHIITPVIPIIKPLTKSP